MADWLALVIGNSRWHWAWFDGKILKYSWHTPHLSTPPTTPLNLRHIWPDEAPVQASQRAMDAMEIWAVSVVPAQSEYLAQMSAIHWIDQFPLEGVYDTMGLDRIATLWGAGQQYHWPVLVIDGGTALTFTAGAHGVFMGGAILLGVRSHLAALNHYTAALPEVSPPQQLPPRWASDTPNAIQSGVLHTLLASIDQFIHSWQQRYPDTCILFTGGDGEYLQRLYCHSPKQNQALSKSTWFDPNLMFWGIAAYRKEATREL